MADASEAVTRTVRPGMAGLVAVQAGATVLMVAFSVLVAVAGWPVEAVAFAALAAVVVFVVCWPLRGGAVDRMIVLLAGACSVAWAVIASDDGARMGDAGSEGLWATVGDLSRPYGRWAAAFVALLVVLTVVGFVRQMARVHRDHMVRFLTNGLTGGVVAIAAAGWMFLPDLMAYGRSGRAPLVALICVVVVGALLVLALAAASWAWWKQEDLDPSVPVPWVGLALIPVMMSGLVAYAMGLSALLVSGR